MTVQNILLEGFRNYDGEKAEFCEGINILSGDNAQGKTNLLEAIYYLSAGRSFRASSEKDMISHDRDNANIRAEILSAGRIQTLEARLSRVKRKEIFANGVKLKKASELMGRLDAVLFVPDDLNMIKEGAAVRRKLIDLRISQLRPRYLAALSEFNRLYEHKMRILRDYREKPSLIDILDDFNLRLAQQSSLIIFYRSAFVGLLSKKSSEIHRDFSGGAEEMTIKYKTVGGINPSGMKTGELLPFLLEHQREHRNAELKTGQCLSGAHKDDLEIEINGLSARKFASQGQARTAAISIKLAERDIHFEDRGLYPVLLLDDVLSELDAQRQRFLLERIPYGQVFITCCEDLKASITSGGTILYVKNGRLF